MPRVSLTRAENYDPEGVVSALRRLLEPLGGMGAFVKPGERVFLKPNLVIGRAPETATATHWSVARAAAILAREAGAGSVAMGDSPGFGDPVRAAETAGFMDVCRELDLPWVLFTPEKTQRPGRPFPVLELAKEVMEADAVINLAKLKTHGQMRMSMAMKNLFGVVPGYRKVQWHYRAGHDGARFARVLYEIYDAVRARLHIVDAIVAMDGLGPTAGHPNPTGFLAAGADGASVDAILADIVGVARTDIPLLVAAREAGDDAYDQAEAVGEAPSALRPAKFDVPRLRPPVMHGEWVQRFFPRVARWLRNQLSASPYPGAGCVRCGVCAECCPAKVIAWEKGGVPLIDLERCIRCYCCHELCPHQAMGLRSGGWLGRRLKLR